MMAGVDENRVDKLRAVLGRNGEISKDKLCWAFPSKLGTYKIESSEATVVVNTPLSRKLAPLYEISPKDIDDLVIHEEALFHSSLPRKVPEIASSVLVDAFASRHLEESYDLTRGFAELHVQLLMNRPNYWHGLDESKRKKLSQLKVDMSIALSGNSGFPFAEDLLIDPVTSGLVNDNVIRKTVDSDPIFFLSSIITGLAYLAGKEPPVLIEDAPHVLAGWGTLLHPRWGSGSRLERSIRRFSADCWRQAEERIKDVLQVLEVVGQLTDENEILRPARTVAHFMEWSYHHQGSSTIGNREDLARSLADWTTDSGYTWKTPFASKLTLFCALIDVIEGEADPYFLPGVLNAIQAIPILTLKLLGGKEPIVLLPCAVAHLFALGGNPDSACVHDAALQRRILTLSKKLPANSSGLLKELTQLTLEYLSWILADEGLCCVDHQFMREIAKDRLLSKKFETIKRVSLSRSIEKVPQSWDKLAREYYQRGGVSVVDGLEGFQKVFSLR